MTQALRQPCRAPCPSRVRSISKCSPIAVSARAAGRALSVTAYRGSPRRIPSKAIAGIEPCEGGRDGGFVLYLKGGHLGYGNNPADMHSDRIRSDASLRAGKQRVSCVPEKDDAGQRGYLFVNSREAGSVPVPQMFMPSYPGGSASAAVVARRSAKAMKAAFLLKERSRQFASGVGQVTHSRVQR